MAFWNPNPSAWSSIQQADQSMPHSVGNYGRNLSHLGQGQPSHQAQQPWRLGIPSYEPNEGVPSDAFHFKVGVMQAQTLHSLNQNRGYSNCVQPQSHPCIPPMYGAHFRNNNQHPPAPPAASRHQHPTRGVEQQFQLGSTGHSGTVGSRLN